MKIKRKHVKKKRNRILKLKVKKGKMLMEMVVNGL